MKKYFYTDGTNNFGPFTFEELKEKNITRETNVWFQGLGAWAPAGNVAELNDLFKLVPPPRTGPTTNYTQTTINEPPPRSNTTLNYGGDTRNQIPPKTWLVESILATIFCCLPLGIVGIVNATRVESRFHAGDIAGATSSSEDAKRWTIISFWIGLAVGIISFITTFMSHF